MQLCGMTSRPGVAALACGALDFRVCAFHFRAVLLEILTSPRMVEAFGCFLWRVRVQVFRIGLVWHRASEIWNVNVLESY